MQRKIIDDLAKDCLCIKEWCFFREILKHVGVGEREAEHMRLVFDYKFIQSVDEGKDIGEERAFNEWISKGYGARFAAIYVEGMTHEELKYKVIIDKNSLTENHNNGKKNDDEDEPERDPIKDLEETWKNNNLHKQILEDLAQDCPCKKRSWCFLREFVSHTGLGDREAEQIRLIYTLKFLMSKKEKRDVGADEEGEKRVLSEWFTGGYAPLFRKIYKDGMTHEDLKYEIFVKNAPAVVRIAT